MPAEVSTDAINYHVLNKRDEHLGQIIHTSSICNVYKFNETDGEWDQLDFQGPLFIYSRKESPDCPYALLVLNRSNMQNFSLPVVPTALSVAKGQREMEVKLEDPFIMIQDGSGDVFGLWIYSETERPQVMQMLQWCLNVKTN